MRSFEQPSRVLLVALLASTTLGVDCRRVAGDVTQVEVEIATNFDPRELTSIRVAVTTADGAALEERVFAPADLRFGAGGIGGIWLLSFAVVPSAGATQWRVAASVESHGRTLVSSFRRGTFSPDAKATVRIVLDRRCIDRATLRQRVCPDDQTCGSGGLCTSSVVSDDASTMTCAREAERLACVSACGAPGEAICERRDDALVVGTCTPFRELPGDGQDNDCRPETRDDGSCASRAREARDGMYDEELCVAGGSFWLGDLDARSPFADADDRGTTFLSHRASAVSLRERPARRVVVSALWVDRHEVSVARFREYFDETNDYRDPTGGRREGCTFTPGAASGDDMPMNCIGWEGAQAFCAWDGARDGRRGRLPTEAEWEWIAGGDTERTFPWGEDIPSCAHAYASLRWLDDLLDECDPAVVEDTALLCQFVGCEDFANTAARSLPAIAALPGLPGEPASLHGLVGNVAEWMLDAWDADAFARRCAERDCTDAEVADQNPLVLDDRATSYALRGGSFASPPSVVRVNARGHASEASSSIGFRCVRDD